MATKTCMFCSLDWTVSVLDRQNNYVCPRCEKFLQSHKGKVVQRNKTLRKGK